MKRRILGIALALTMVMVMVMPMGVGAAEGTDTTTVSGSIGATYTIVAPGTVTLGTLSTSVAVSSVAQSITVSTNDTTVGGSHHVVVGVTGEDGKLALNGSGVALEPALTVSSTLIGWAAVTLSSTKENGTASFDISNDGTETFNDVVITQPAIIGSTPQSGSYSEIITFTATFN